MSTTEICLQHSADAASMQACNCDTHNGAACAVTSCYVMCLAVLCSAGVIAMDLARELLQLHPEKVALVVSHENITNNFYSGEFTRHLRTVFLQSGGAGLCSQLAATWSMNPVLSPCALRTLYGIYA